MKIVRADSNHLDLLAPLFTAYRQFYRERPAPGAEQGYLSERFANDEAVAFLALDPDDPDNAIGFVLLYPTFDSVSLIATWTLHDLYVDEDYRRQGFARALMQRAAAFCRRSGAGRIDLATAITNTVAQPLYESLGYEREREFYRYSLTLDDG